ncbi:MAG: hypothetical protein HY265_08910 [Deltaproteobacteria bacterium]|nr:hypothetical protein [Deltaproteobacteria bacterium]MBI3756265.1 hypothetical protein [Deltaproteobacteria bacterium]
MLNICIRCLLISFIFFPSTIGIGAESSSEFPPPILNTQSQFTDKRVFGLKYNILGIIDPSPDVIPLEYLPRDEYGFIDWSKAINEGIIFPKGFVIKGEEENIIVLIDDIIIRSKMDFMPDVLFSHDIHNNWLSCNNCHPKIFQMKKGATPISMRGIWNGEFCGRCHDKVAFPLRNCFRCHSVRRDTKQSSDK